MNLRKQAGNKQAGNALFLILIAVALFAALSYAVTQTGRGGGNTSKEQTALLASQIVQRTEMIRTAVQRMILTGTPASSILCTNNGTPDLAYDCDNGSGNPNAFCTTGANCIFGSAGGGAEVPVFPPQVFTSNAGCTARLMAIDGFNSTPDTVLPGVGTGAPEDMLKVFCLSQEVCTEINKGLGITGIPVEAALPSGKEAMCWTTTWPGLGNNYTLVLQAN